MNITKENKELEIKTLTELAKELFGHTKPLSLQESKLLDEELKRQSSKKPYTI